MLINAEEDFTLLKSIFLEPFKGGGGGGRGGSSRRKNKDGKDGRPLSSFNLPIFLFFAVLYSLTFVFFSTRK